ncbi:MAG: iron-sulfur cluster assembly scaffold protein [Candidatus Nealsonbacteria bacterium]|nr:iron-sulfur cluster assembly scaffold protein [Candidatus Nealsonbacteria bacterium]
MANNPYYSKEILEHFMHPKNLGAIKNADGIGDTQNMRCGDIMKVYITVEDKKGKTIIKDAKFETFGCGHAVAISDMICELIKGKTFEQALRVGFEDIKKAIGPVPPVKIHCATLAQAGVRAAIEDYQKKQK